MGEDGREGWKWIHVTPDRDNRTKLLEDHASHPFFSLFANKQARPRKRDGPTHCPYPVGVVSKRVVNLMETRIGMRHSLSPYRLCKDDSPADVEYVLVID